MNPILKNILAFIVGFILGNVVNMLIIIASFYIIPYPEGMTMGDPDSLKEHIGDFEIQHFIMPFLAHALGTLVAVFVAAKMAASRELLLAMIIGALFLAAGIYNAATIGGPMWFNAVDVAFAYIPMAYIGLKLSGK